jgi:hypothetical protein
MKNERVMLCACNTPPMYGMNDPQLFAQFISDRDLNKQSNSEWNDKRL